MAVAVPKRTKRGKPDLAAAMAEIEAREAAAGDDDLLPGEPPPPRPVLDPTEEMLAARSLPIELVVPSDANPRVETDAERQKELNASVKVHGVLSPLLVRPMDNGRYELIAGWRRWTAAKAGKLETVPVIVMTAEDQRAQVLSLVENIQREDLDPIDEARAFQRLLELPKDDGKRLSQTELARMVGKSQPYISNAIRILALPEEIQTKVQSGEITVGAAKAIVSLPKEAQARVAKEASKKGRTTQQVEQSARFERERIERDAADKAKYNDTVEKISEAIAEARKAKVIKKGTVIRVDERYLADLDKAGVKGVSASDHRNEVAKNGFACDCNGVRVDVTGGYVYSNEPVKVEVRAVCLNREHPEAQRAEERAKQEEEYKRQIATVNEAREKVMAAATTDAGISDLGLRFILYSAVFAKVQYGGADPSRVERFAERHEMEVGDLTDTAWGWDFISQMDPVVIARELVGGALLATFSNVYADNARFENRLHHGVRAALAKDLDIDVSIEWGGHQPLLVEPDVTEGAAEDGIAEDEPHRFSPDMDAGPDDDGFFDCVICGALEDDDIHLKDAESEPMGLDPETPPAEEPTPITKADLEQAAEEEEDEAEPAVS